MERGLHQLWKAKETSSTPNFVSKQLLSFTLETYFLRGSVPSRPWIDVLDVKALKSFYARNAITLIFVWTYRIYLWAWHCYESRDSPTVVPIRGKFWILCARSTRFGRRSLSISARTVCEARFATLLRKQSDLPGKDARWSRKTSQTAIPHHLCRFLYCCVVCINHVPKSHQNGPIR